MATRTTTTLHRPTAEPRIVRVPAPPPLEAGDRLTSKEFLRRYEAMPNVKKAELIEGVVYMPSPVSAVNHGDPHFLVIGWLSGYMAATPGVVGSDNATCLLDPDNNPQPDVHLRIEPSRGGASRLGDDGYVVGPPELIVEVAASSASYDLHDKLNAYRRNGVREYLVWRTFDGDVDWFVLRDGVYERQAADGAGLLTSEVFPGLRLDVAALVRRDLSRVLAALREGLATPEHAAFVERLAGVTDRASEGGGPS